MMNNYRRKLATAGLLTFTVFTGLINSPLVSAAAVTTGHFDLILDRQLIHDNGGEYGTEILRWFDAERSANKSECQLRNCGADPLNTTFDGSVNPDLSVAQVFSFDVYGSTVPSPPLGLGARFPKNSTFTFASGNPYSNNGGRIGLGGVMVLAYTEAVPGGGSSTFGDFSMTNVGANWLLTNHVSFTSPFVSLTDVTTTIIDDNNFSLSGNVKYANSGVANFMRGEFGETIGTFSFTTVVPVPGAVWLFGSGLVGLLGSRYRRASTKMSS
jgi:hypothetical protein